MSITVLIEKLSAIQKEHGDLPCMAYCCDRDDTTIGFVDTIKVVESDELMQTPKHVFISSENVYQACEFIAKLRTKQRDFKDWGNA